MTSSLSRHPAFLSLQGGINFRDLGGQLAADGRASAAASYCDPAR